MLVFREALHEKYVGSTLLTQRAIQDPRFDKAVVLCYGSNPWCAPGVGGRAVQRNAPTAIFIGRLTASARESRPQ